MEKKFKYEIIYFCIMAALSGVMIGIGGTASLLANALLGAQGKLIGSLLFSLGIFAIIAFEMNLFTGMVSKIPTMGAKNYWKLAVCFICNILGVAFVAILVYFTPLRDTVQIQARSIAEAKLVADGGAWVLRSLCSSILCGILITLSVWSVKYAPKKGLSATVGAIFPIVVFAFCGFDHSVANMLYFYFYGQVSWLMIGYILISMIGNIIGGVLVPLAALFKEKMLKDNESAE